MFSNPIAISTYDERGDRIDTLVGLAMACTSAGSVAAIQLI